MISMMRLWIGQSMCEAVEISQKPPDIGLPAGVGWGVIRLACVCPLTRAITFG